ncbi:MAG: hypothetical protein KG003_15100 [Bacteroidetes bacterium]|nr:hypothetical protein [Bacteroidota bacterium]
MEKEEDGRVIPNKAIAELKEALYLAIGDKAADLSPEDLQKLGALLLTTMALGIKIRCRRTKPIDALTKPE